MGQASALVTNSMLEHYGITAGQLQQDAFASAVSHKPFEIKTMAEVLNELMGAEIIPEDAMPIYVASNQERIHGAGVIAYPKFMEEAEKRLGETSMFSRLRFMKYSDSGYTGRFCHGAAGNGTVCQYGTSCPGGKAQ